MPVPHYLFHPSFVRRLVLIAVLSLVSCSDVRRGSGSPPGYDFTRPRVIRLPLELDEISGLTYWAPDSSLMAINDEQGYLYKIPVGAPQKISRWKFAAGNDYEDIAIVDSTFFVLRSNGNVVAFRYTDDADSLYQEVIPFDIGAGNEFEAICAVPGEHRLLLVCKDCEQDNKKTLSLFWLDVSTLQFSEAEGRILTEKIAAAAGKKSVRFKPSAAAFSPVDRRLYLVSSVNKMLVIVSDNEPVNIYRLDARLFKQPEGMTFSPRGDLFISNEAAEVGVAEILIFPYQPHTRP